MDCTISDESLCELIINNLSKELKSGICQELLGIWVELWEENECEKRKEILANECTKEIKDFLQEVLKNERKVRDDYITRIEELLNEINDLQTTLEIPIPYEDVETLPLHIMAARLNKKAEKYRIIRNEQMHKLNELVEKEAALCSKLGMLKQEIDTAEISTKAKLKLMENHINAMEQEKINRTVTFMEQRQAIMKLYEELGKQPLLNFEKEILTENAIEKFYFTNENMEKLHELRKKLEIELENAKEKLEEIKDRLTMLWKYLDEPEEHRQRFLSEQSGYKQKTIKAFEDELERCETKKKENISLIVEKIRGILVEEWDKCHIAKSEREKFRPFNINCFTEDLCDLHELEINRLKNFYQDNKQIFVLMEKHEKLFNRLLDLESGSKNANRYYNRGGQLLLEEKERKVITKELPSVEEELRTLLKIYKESHNEEFTSFGVPVETILDEKWNAHFDQKTVEKLRRKGDKKGRTPLGKRGCTTPYTPLSANKVSRLNVERVPSAVKATPKTAARAVTVRKKNLNGKLNPEATLILEPTYDDFQSGLQSKIERSIKTKNLTIRSTAINEDVAPGILRERNSPNNILPVTPIKSTPAKLATPMYSPANAKTPKTVPRTRRRSQMTRLTPARSRFPIII